MTFLLVNEVVFISIASNIVFLRFYVLLDSTVESKSLMRKLRFQWFESRRVDKLTHHGDDELEFGQYRLEGGRTKIGRIDLFSLSLGFTEPFCIRSWSFCRHVHLKLVLLTPTMLWH